MTREHRVRSGLLEKAAFASTLKGEEIESEKAHLHYSKNWSRPVKKLVWNHSLAHSLNHVPVKSVGSHCKWFIVFTCQHFFGWVYIEFTLYLFISHHKIMPDSSFQFFIAVTITLFCDQMMTDNKWKQHNINIHNIDYSLAYCTTVNS